MSLKKWRFASKRPVGDIKHTHTAITLLESISPFTQTLFAALAKYLTQYRSVRAEYIPGVHRVPSQHGKIDRKSRQNQVLGTGGCSKCLTRLFFLGAAIVAWVDMQVLLLNTGKEVPSGILIILLLESEIREESAAKS